MRRLGSWLFSMGAALCVVVAATCVAILMQTHAWVAIAWAVGIAVAVAGVVLMAMDA